LFFLPRSSGVSCGVDTVRSSLSQAIVSASVKPARELDRTPDGVTTMASPLMSVMLTTTIGPSEAQSWSSAREGPSRKHWWPGTSRTWRMHQSSSRTASNCHAVRSLGKFGPSIPWIGVFTSVRGRSYSAPSSGQDHRRADMSAAIVH
jgi:hypothetical protein